MKAIICTDSDSGITFNGRRVSQDIQQRKDLLNLIGDQPLYMNEKTMKLYCEHPQSRLSNDLARRDQDVCLFETDEINQLQDKIDVLILYNWNRRYPYDSKLELDLSKYEVEEQAEFGGKSHEKITRTIYVKNR